ncbi:glycosyltransferase family protein [Tenacibaculum ovolyticum]|uniref:glycosyltransferase family protein n=1 Tax=Tenacibaculum ovolyticum TaxID=104270 RepID=UPI0022F392C9|nr:glycosyltransferase family protein [Tenacibaculum ovolyticum]WBX76169.1 glycosyltransferase family protein [Tenacibaculum ovolyticum]
MKITAITQARTGSTRLPNKIMKKIKGKTLLNIHIDRIKKANKIDNIIIATTNNADDDVVEELAKDLNVKCYRGNEDDVLDRFYQAVKKDKPDYIVRLTSDCPLIDGHLIDEIIEKTINSKVDYCSNTLVESFPDGQDIEVFTFKSLEKTWKEAVLLSEREHVTPYIKKNSTFNDIEIFKSMNIYSNSLEFENVRMTVDEPNDFEVISKLIDKLGLGANWKNYARLYLKDSQINSFNKNIIRNEGYLKSIKKDS